MISTWPGKKNTWLVMFTLFSLSISYASLSQNISNDVTDIFQCTYLQDPFPRQAGRHKLQLCSYQSSELLTCILRQMRNSTQGVTKLLAHVIDSCSNQLSRQPIQSFMQSLAALSVTRLNVPAASTAQLVQVEAFRDRLH